MSEFQDYSHNLNMVSVENAEMEEQQKKRKRRKQEIQPKKEFIDKGIDCKYCEIICKSSEALQNHVRTQHGHECDWCDKIVR